MTGPPVFLCRRCRQLKPHTDEFFHRSSAARGRRLTLTCKACRREQSRARYARLREDPDWMRRKREREAKRAREVRATDPVRAQRHRDAVAAYERRIAADPERLALRRIDDRIYRHLRAERAGRDPSTMRLAATPYDGYEAPFIGANGGAHVGPMLDARPIAEWLGREFGSWPTKFAARRLGVDEATVRRLLNGEAKSVSLHVADRIFVSADCTHLLAVLYPPDGEGATCPK